MSATTAERIAVQFDPTGLTMRQKVFAFATMTVGFFIALLDIQIVSASLRDIGGGLSAGSDEVAWVQTSYLIAEIIVIPLSGWLSRVMSTRWLFSISAAGFTITSLMCGWAWDIQSMIIFRALQGFLGGSMIPTVFTTAFFYFQGHQRVIAAATIGALSSLAPTLGPTVGGWITDNYSWHWLFFINLVPGIFVTIVVPIMVKIDKPDWSLVKGADYFGMALMAVFLGCLEYTLEEGPRWDWFGDDTIRTTAWISAVAGAAFIYRSLTFARPGGRPASAEKPQLRARLFLLLHDRRRDFRDDLSDSPVPGQSARVQRPADRSRGVLDRHFPDHGDPVSTPSSRARSTCAG